MMIIRTLCSAVSLFHLPGSQASAAFDIRHSDFVIRVHASPDSDP
jgi:hypothetical protein